MSTATVLTRAFESIDATIRRNVRVLAADIGVRAPDIYRPLGISRQTYSSRLNGSTRFSAAEVISIAQILGCTVEELSGPTHELTALHQNRKKMNGPDLQGLPGGRKGGQRSLPFEPLVLVKSPV